MGLFEVRTISISIQRDFKEVYSFLSKPDNFSKWASGLGQSLKNLNGEWTVETAEGPLKARFTGSNEFGILDHFVTSERGEEIYVPMRVVQNGTGSELIFTLFRAPLMPDEKFAEDANWVERDLKALKELLEK
jgi:hypothetical protein